MKLKIVIPKGRIFEKIKNLLKDAGYVISDYERNYRPKCNVKDVEIKILKPQNIGKLIELGQHDIGFTGYDWVVEKDANVEEILDLNFDPVSIVSAIPKGSKQEIFSKKKIIVASEYPTIASNFLKREGFNFVLLQTYGATEVFPPEDADMIIDNTSTGKTLQDNDLEIYKIVMKSSTRFVANKEAMKDDWKRKKILELKMLIESVLIARKKVIVEMNVSDDKLKDLIAVIPCMRSPTINKLYDGGYAVKSVIPRSDITEILPLLKKAGATDILEYEISRVIL
jgi:ATP phosphoribosyltransferase